MKILILGPKARYDAHMPDFVPQLPVEKVFCPARQQDPLLSVTQHPDAEILLTDAITPVTREMIQLLPNLKMIHSEGVAYNWIDLEAAREQGVFVCNNKGCNSSAVAEHTLMLMLMSLHFGITGHRAVREGRQIQMKETIMAQSSLGLGQCSIGLVGMGDIAQALVKLLRPFGSKLFYYTAHRRPPEFEQEMGLTYLPLQELAAQCDILSLHCSVNDQTRNMVDANLLSLIKPGAILVNSARGELMDNQAVRQALIDGRLGMLSADTLAPEPTPADHPLVDLPPEIADKAIYSPHLGGITGGAFDRAHANMWNSVRLVLEGKRPNFIVNGL